MELSNRLCYLIAHECEREITELGLRNIGEEFQDGYDDAYDRLLFVTDEADHMYYWDTEEYTEPSLMTCYFDTSFPDSRVVTDFYNSIARSTSCPESFTQLFPTSEIFEELFKIAVDEHFDTTSHQIWT